MQFTEAELKILRSKLPKGSSQKLAEKTGLKPGSIRNILSGLSNNDAVIIEAFNLVKELEDKVSQTKAALSA